MQRDKLKKINKDELRCVPSMYGQSYNEGNCNCNMNWYAPPPPPPQSQLRSQSYVPATTSYTIMDTQPPRFVFNMLKNIRKVLLFSSNI